MNRVTALKTTCPKCGAPPRMPCMGKKGPRVSCHQQRHGATWNGKYAPSKGVRASRCVTQGKIYFLRAEGTDLIKIGWTARDLRGRMRALQTGCPHKLKILATMPGDQRKEQSLHAAFKSLRVQGEWFRDEGPLSETIDSILTSAAA